MKYSGPMMLVLLLVTATSVRAECMDRTGVYERKSPSGQFSVRVTPGDRWSDIRPFAKLPSGDKYATAEWHRSTNGVDEKFLTATLLNSVYPDEMVVTDDGMLVTIDNLCSAGVGVVLVIYSPAGKVIGKYGLSDLYSAGDIWKFATSAEGATVWRCYAASSLVSRSPGELWIDDQIGGRLVVNPGTGTFAYQRGVSSCGTNAARRSELLEQQLSQDKDPDMVKGKALADKYIAENVAKTGDRAVLVRVENRDDEITYVYTTTSLDPPVVINLEDYLVVTYNKKTGAIDPAEPLM